jgi:hypothetical protein
MQNMNVTPEVEPPIQRNLDWLSRFLFYGSSLSIPIGLLRRIIPTVDVSRDWPEEIRVINRDYVTVAFPAVLITALDAAQGRHLMIDYIQVFGVMPAGEIVHLYLVAPGGTSVLISRTAPAAGTNLVSPLTRPLYVPPGFQASLVHYSVAGGVGMECRLSYRDYPAYRPILPL